MEFLSEFGIWITRQARIGDTVSVKRREMTGRSQILPWWRGKDDRKKIHRPRWRKLNIPHKMQSKNSEYVADCSFKPLTKAQAEHNRKRSRHRRYPLMVSSFNTTVYCISVMPLEYFLFLAEQCNSADVPDVTLKKSHIIFTYLLQHPCHKSEGIEDKKGAGKNVKFLPVSE